MSIVGMPPIIPHDGVAPIPVYVPKHLDLPQHEIDRLNREKADLLAGLKARMPKPEPAPEVVAHEEPTVEDEDFPSLLPRKITADGRKLAGLATRARKLEAIADAANEKARLADEAAMSARSALRDYMREHGL